MALNAKITISPRVKVKVRDAGLIPTASPITLKNVVNASVNRFDELNDVTEGANPSNGFVPQYNSSSDKYEVRRLDIDGGSF